MAARNIVVLAPDKPPQSPAERVKRLQEEARQLALQHAESLVTALKEASRVAEEVAAGGDVYPVGARELARRVTDEASAHALTLAAILDRMS